MDLIKSISAALFIILGAWMIATIYCQFMALRHVRPERHWVYKKAIRKWEFDAADEVVAPEGKIWLARVTWLLKSGLALLAVCAFAMVGIVMWGPEAAATVNE